MEALFTKDCHIAPTDVDRYGRLKASRILALIQDVSGDHSDLLGTNREALMERGLFWAIIRHRVQITRLPGAGETLRLETWPMPTTRTAFPRSTIAYDADGHECFRSISLWILMDANTRAMVLPGKSGVEVTGLLRGCELAAPGSIIPRDMGEETLRTVRYTDLDVNGHMNNCRYLDWVEDLLPSAFHAHHQIREFTLCYISEIREGEQLHLHWEVENGPNLLVEATRHGAENDSSPSRVFSGRIIMESVVL